jgi:hypothetical protein
MQSIKEKLTHYIYYIEVALWLTGILLLMLMDPDGVHMFSFCPFSWMLENGCLGCGLGHSIAYLCRGELQASWESHPLAIPALVLLVRRCVQLLNWQHKHLRYLNFKRDNG